MSRKISFKTKSDLGPIEKTLRCGDENRSRLSRWETQDEFARVRVTYLFFFFSFRCGAIPVERNKDIKETTRACVLHTYAVTRLLIFPTSTIYSPLFLECPTNFSSYLTYLCYFAWEDESLPGQESLRGELGEKRRRRRGRLLSLRSSYFTRVGTLTTLVVLASIVSRMYCERSITEDFEEWYFVFSFLSFFSSTLLNTITRCFSEGRRKPFFIRFYARNIRFLKHIVCATSNVLKKPIPSRNFSSSLILQILLILEDPTQAVVLHWYCK